MRRFCLPAGRQARTTTLDLVCFSKLTFHSTPGFPKGALGTHRNYCTNLINVGMGAIRAFYRRGEPLPVPDPNMPQKVFLLPVGNVAVSFQTLWLTLDPSLASIRSPSSMVFILGFLSYRAQPN